MGSLNRLRRHVEVVSVLVLTSTGCQGPKPGEEPMEVTTVALTARPEVATVAPNASPEIGGFAIYAQNSARLGDQVAVSGGDVGVSLAGAGPFLVKGYELALEREAQVDGARDVIANRVLLRHRAHVGDVQANRLKNDHGRYDHLYAFPSKMPALPPLASVSPGKTEVKVAEKKTVTLAAGGYGAVTIRHRGVLRLAGGVYHVASIRLDDKARIEALAPVQILVAGRFDADAHVWIGAASDVTLTAGDLRIEVSGKNGKRGSLSDDPKAADFGHHSTIHGVMLVPNGTLRTGHRMEMVGAYAARDVHVDNDSRVHFQSGLGPLGCSGSCDDGNPCTTDACSGGVCAHTPAALGTSCSDGNACNGTETCDGAAHCRPGTPVTCTARDDCHLAGECDPATGTCTNPTKLDGTACNDGNLCTQTDTCVAGTCTGANPVACTALDQCHVAGECLPATGTCTNPTKPDGTTCDDDSLCTQADTCVAGACTGGAPKTCVALDQCHDAGECDRNTGECSQPAKPNGTPCTDGNACTESDSCRSGFCVGGTPVACPVDPTCDARGTCDPGTGACKPPSASITCGDGSLQACEKCDDGNTVDGDGCSAVCAFETCANGTSSRTFQTLTFFWVGRSCGAAQPDDIVFSLNGVEVARAALRETCDCAPGLGVVEVTDPALLAFGRNGENQLKVETTGELAWAGASSNGPDNAWLEKIWDVNGDYDPSHRPADLCTGGAQRGISESRTLTVSSATACAVCGNGTVQPGEECDDGNSSSGDGCSSACKFETCANGKSSRELQALSFSWLGHSCGAAPPADIVFTLNGVEVARAPLAESCECAGRVQTYTVTDPTLLALGKVGGNVVAVRSTGQVAWAAAHFQFPFFGFTQKVWDAGDDYDPTHRSADLCAAALGSGAVAFTWIGLAGGTQCGTCGNGNIEIGESCDDGNSIGGDGCSSTCAYETCANGRNSLALESLSFAWLGRSCGLSQPADIVFLLSGREIGRAPLPATCDCTPGPQILTVTDPTLLASVRAGSATVLAVTDGDLAWANVTFQTPTATWPQRLWDANDGWDTSSQPVDLCAFGSSPGVATVLGTGFSGGGQCGTCGDGNLELGEDCDDGNLVGGDGCSTACRYETCADGVSSRALQTLKFEWLGRSCGLPQPADIVFTVNSVEVARAPLAASCDCAPEAGTVEVTDPALLAVAKNGGNVVRVYTAGDLASVNMYIGTRAGAWRQKVWDATGNWNPYYLPTDLCTYGARTGVAEHTWVGFSGGGECPVCGNNRVEILEECDDGNLVAGDGCSPTCKSEVCGHGTVDPGEECDDGNGDNEDACTNACILNRCQGVVCTPDPSCSTPGVCDPGTGQCSPSTNCASCGNGALEAGEECDDGNTVGGDGCSASCVLEMSPAPA